MKKRISTISLKRPGIVRTGTDVTVGGILFRFFFYFQRVGEESDS